MNSRDLSVLSAIDLSRLVCTLHGKGDSKSSVILRTDLRQLAYTMNLKGLVDVPRRRMKCII